MAPSGYMAIVLLTFLLVTVSTTAVLLTIYELMCSVYTDFSLKSTHQMLLHCFVECQTSMSILCDRCSNHINMEDKTEITEQITCPSSPVSQILKALKMWTQTPSLTLKTADKPIMCFQQPAIWRVEFGSHIITSHWTWSPYIMNSLMMLTTSFSSNRLCLEKVCWRLLIQIFAACTDHTHSKGNPIVGIPCSQMMDPTPWTPQSPIHCRSGMYPAHQPARPQTLVLTLHPPYRSPAAAALRCVTTGMVMLVTRLPSRTTRSRLFDCDVLQTE